MECCEYCGESNFEKRFYTTTKSKSYKRCLTCSTLKEVED